LSISIAVAGKGGTGKTTLSALMVRILRHNGIRPILAVDADPNSTLAEALGTELGKPLADIREEKSTAEGSPPSGTGRVRAIEDEIQRAISEEEGFDLIGMGHPEGPRCYCYVNTLLRKSLDDLARNYQAVVLDNEAGMEHLSRRTTNDVDFLIAVMNPTLPSLRAVQRIIKLTDGLPINIGQRAVLVNRVGPEGIPPEIQSELDAIDALRLIDVPQDDTVEHAGAVGENVFRLAEDCPAVEAVRRVVKTLCTASRPSASASH